MEVAPGVHRLDYAIGAKPMAAYVIAGDTVTIVDTGIATTPEEIYLPAIRSLGRSVDDVRLVVITHADADHMGGNHATRAIFPAAIFVCHQLDARWASDPEIITAERYDAFTDYGLRHGQAVFDVLANWMGPSVPMDFLVEGGERLRITARAWLEFIHLPGHTPGHIGLHNADEGYALIGDAVFGSAQLDTQGQWLAPPSYRVVSDYLQTIEMIESLQLEMLLTCHYPVLRGTEIRRFLDESRRFVSLADALARTMLCQAPGPITLSYAVDMMNQRLGPFLSPIEGQVTMLAHFDHLVQLGEARVEFRDGIASWVASTGDL